MQALSINELKSKADEHRKTLVEVTHSTGGSYLAQALSCIDMMTALFYKFMRADANRPHWPERDRFLLSPGHYALPLYVTLADLGYFDAPLLQRFKENGSPVELATHRGTLSGVEVTGGSLGQALSVGVGMALHAKLRKKEFRVFVMMSDGEQDEGQIWEAAASASHFKLDNLVAVIDKNGFQVDGATSQVMNMDPLEDKYRAFGWEVRGGNGHDMAGIVASLEELLQPSGRPGIFVGHTVRGKGLSFMENNPLFHYTRLSDELHEKADEELQAGWDAV